MKNRFLLLGAMALVGVLGVGLASCGGSNNDSIKLYSREAGSGTRECFFEGIGYGDVAKENVWNKGVVVSSAASNGAIMTSVGNDESGLGYCSLDSLDTVSSIKGLSFEGVAASEETVVNGTYKLQRNFNFVSADSSLLDAQHALAKDAFVAFMTESKEGLQAIAAEGGILTKSVASAKSWSEIATSEFPNLDIEGVTINACGSTSVENVLNGLASAFKEATGCTVTPNQTGSGDAVPGVTGEGSTKYEIGFLSREIKDDEKASLTDANARGAICKDAVVPIVNAANTAVTNSTAEALTAAYKGEITTWSEFAELVA